MFYAPLTRAPMNMTTFAFSPSSRPLLYRMDNTEDPPPPNVVA